MQSRTLPCATNCSRCFPTAATSRLPAMFIANRAANPWTTTGACCTRFPATARTARASAIRWCRCRNATTFFPTCRRKRTNTASRRFMPTRKFWISMRWRIKLPSLPRIFRRARPGQPLAAGFFQPAPAQVPPDMIRHQQDLIGPVAQFLTGLFPAIFGGNMEDVKTASGYALARDQAMGRLGLVRRRTKQFYADVLLLAVDSFRKNRPEDVEIPLLGPDGVLDARSIRAADLKGNICVHPEADETFPRLKSQQRGVLQQLFSINDPVLQRALTEPANLGYIKNVLGLAAMVIPGEDSRNKQLREIQQLLASAPIVVNLPLNTHSSSASPPAGAQHAAHLQSAPQDSGVGATLGSPGADDGEMPGTSHQSHALVLPSVPVDQLLDDHAVEFEECKRWANSEAGQSARMTNPAGFANVRAHTEAHLRAMSQAALAQMPAPPQPNAKGKS